jgi:ribosomal protein S20
MAYSSEPKIEYEKKVTIDFVVNEASAVFKWVKKAKYDNNDPNKCNDIIAQIQKDHPEFSKSYPIVVRYMVHFHQYRRRALQKYLKRITVKPWQNEEEYLDSQADYATILFRESTPHHTQVEAKRVWERVRNELGNEKEKFKTMAKTIGEAVEKDETAAKAASVTELIENIISLGEKDIDMDCKVIIDPDLC